MFNRKKRRIEDLQTQVEAFKLDSDTWKKLYEEILAKYLRADAQLKSYADNITNIHADPKPEHPKKYTYFVSYYWRGPDGYLNLGNSIFTLPNKIKCASDIVLLNTEINSGRNRNTVLSFQLLEGE